MFLFFVHVAPTLVVSKYLTGVMTRDEATKVTVDGTLYGECGPVLLCGWCRLQPGTTDSMARRCTQPLGFSGGVVPSAGAIAITLAIPLVMYSVKHALLINTCLTVLGSFLFYLGLDAAPSVDLTLLLVGRM